MRQALIIIFTLVMASCAPQYGPTYPSPPPDRVVNTGESCGGFVGFVCGQPGDFCKTTIGDQCGAADQMGMCSPRPQICTRDYRPVCGCDGKTYSNECTANGAGVSAAYAGACRN